MKVMTNSGEVELTAKMVRQGMVFVWGRFTFTIRDLESDWLMGDERVSVLDLPRRAGTLEGCDPAIAAREDCEVYGIAPGIDAGAAGFARLRDGGALDLHDEAPIGMVYEYEGARFTVQSRNCGTRPGVHHLGLDARYARPKDVERMCCGGSEVREEDGALWRTGKRCTLAIGHSGEHEDLATGTKWGGAAPMPLPEEADRLYGKYSWAAGAITAAHAMPVTQVAVVSAPSSGSSITAGTGVGTNRTGARCARCHALPNAIGCSLCCAAATTPSSAMARTPGKVVRCCADCGAAEGAMHQETCPDMLRRRADWEATHCGARTEPGQALIDRCAELDGHEAPPRVASGHERCGLSKGHDGRCQDWNHDVSWTHPAVMLLCSECGERTGPDAVGVIHGTPSGRMERRVLCPRCAVGGSGERERRAREAPLVALVADVPEGLDARGWRAAVLACVEVQSPETVARWIEDGSLRQWVIDAIRVKARGPAAHAAYLRAIASPGPRPQPERWRGGRDARLMVDDGRDND